MSCTHRKMNARTVRRSREQMRDAHRRDASLRFQLLKTILAQPGFARSGAILSRDLENETGRIKKSALWVAISHRLWTVLVSNDPTVPINAFVRIVVGVVVI